MRLNIANLIKGSSYNENRIDNLIYYYNDYYISIYGICRMVLA